MWMFWTWTGKVHCTQNISFSKNYVFQNKSESKHNLKGIWSSTSAPFLASDKSFCANGEKNENVAMKVISNIQTDWCGERSSLFKQKSHVPTCVRRGQMVSPWVLAIVHQWPHQGPAGCAGRTVLWLGLPCPVVWLNKLHLDDEKQNKWGLIQT